VRGGGVIKIELPNNQVDANNPIKVTLDTSILEDVGSFWQEF
jgi:hypothetical protein